MAQLKCNGCWEDLERRAPAFATTCAHLFCKSSAGRNMYFSAMPSQSLPEARPCSAGPSCMRTVLNSPESTCPICENVVTKRCGSAAGCLLLAYATKAVCISVNAGIILDLHAAMSRAPMCTRMPLLSRSGSPTLLPGPSSTQRRCSSLQLQLCKAPTQAPFPAVCSCCCVVRVQRSSWLWPWQPSSLQSSKAA